MKHVCLVTLVLLLPALAPAQSEAPVRLAYYEYGLLYNKNRGIDKEVVEEVMHRMGVSHTFQVLARARIWKDLESGDLDLATSGIETAERNRFAWFVPYLSIKNMALIAQKVAGRVNSFDQFFEDKGLRWGVVTSFRHGEEQDQWVGRLRAAGRVDESPTVEVLFRKLREGRVDGFFSQAPVYKAYLADLNMEALAAIQDWTPQEKGVEHGLVLAKSRFTVAEVQKWRAALEQMRNDGTLRSVYLKYLSALEAEQALDY